MSAVVLLLVCALLGLGLGAVFSTEEFAASAGGAADAQAVLEQRELRREQALAREQDLAEAGVDADLFGPGSQDPADPHDTADTADTATGSDLDAVPDTEPPQRLLSVPVALLLGSVAGALVALIALGYAPQPSVGLWFFVVPAAALAASVLLSAVSFVRVDLARRRQPGDADDPGAGADAAAQRAERGAATDPSGYGGLDQWSR